MGPRSRHGFLVAATSVAAAAAFKVSTNFAMADYDNEAAAEQVASELSGDYIIQNGSFEFFFLDDCARFNLPTCYALNADTPYGITGLPLAPGETVYTDCDTKRDQCGAGCLVEGLNLDQGICNEASNQPTQWRLGEGEAIVLIGTAPPEMIYWSITSYVWTRAYEGSPRSIPLDTDPWVMGRAASCPDAPGRCQVFASLGAPFNYETLTNRTGGTGYSEPFALVLTSSKEAWDSISAAVERAGAPAFLHPVPADALNLGTGDQKKDTLGQVMRVAYPADQQAVQAYFDAAPVSVLRLTPREGGGSSSYLRKDLTHAERTTGIMERGGETLTHEQLKDALRELEDKVKQEHGRGIHTPFVKPYFTTGMDCVDMGTECNGDCPDAIYPVSENIFYAEACALLPVVPGLVIACLCAALLCGCCFAAPTRSRGCCPPEGVPNEEFQAEYAEWFWARFPVCGFALKDSQRWWTGLTVTALVGFLIALYFSMSFYGSFCLWGHGATIDSSDNDFYVVIGVNHKATSMATYASITAYNFKTLVGLYTASSESGWSGSAARYLGEDHPANPYLYAYRFARDCTKAGLSGNCFDVPTTGSEPLPIGGHMFFIARAYMHPQTKTAPSQDEVIFPENLHFY